MKEWIEKITDYFKADHRTFAQGVCFYKLVWVFTIGSIFGVYYEQILNLMKSLLADGTIFWESRRGVIYGPLSPVYGAGAALIVYLLARRKRPGWQTWLYGALLGGAFEYTISFLQEWAIGTTSWDYSQQFLNINGRTTIPIMIAWGILAFILIEYVYPWLSKWIESFPYRFGVLFTRILVVFLVFDMTVSWTALFRQTLRRQNKDPYTAVGRLYDQIYTDEFLEKSFPNMEARGR